jgi:hypothetical protein
MANPHWSLFEVIDEDLHAFSREVEFAAANLSTYSVTLVRLYLSICSEVDVIAGLKSNMLTVHQRRESNRPAIGF